MVDKLQKVLILVLGVLAFLFWYQKIQVKEEKFQAEQTIRKQKISQDSLIKLSDGYYRKLVGDTLTQSELKRLAEKIVELENRKPISVTKTIIQPVKVEKETDSIYVGQDSVFIADYYPKKENYFLKYTNNFSLETQEGNSEFDFQPLTLTEVVTKKEDGLYQIDFVTPDFIEVNSIDIQTEPLATPEPDNWGDVFGIEYGQNLETGINLIELNYYKRYKKFYFGGAISTNKDLKGGIKFEF